MLSRSDEQLMLHDQFTDYREVPPYFLGTVVAQKGIFSTLPFL